MLPFLKTIAILLLGNIVDIASGFSSLSLALTAYHSSSPLSSHTSNQNHPWRLYDGKNQTSLYGANGDGEFEVDAMDDEATVAASDADSSKLIFLLTDGTGATVKSSVQRSLDQFEATNVRTRLFSFVRGEEIAASIIQKASERGAMIISTIRVRVLREKILRMCELEGVPAVDLLGPSLDGLESYLQRLPVNVPSMYDPGQVRVLSDAYYRRIDALQFTLKADDGQAPWLLAEADVILVGVSRSGKTPLSVTLSQSTGLRVANIPLVLECPPPKELLDESTIDPQRVFCLTVSPSQLKKIRETRLEQRLGVKAMEAAKGQQLLQETITPSGNGSGNGKSNYADRAYILKDLKNAFDLKEKYGWTQIDVTGRAVEDIASQIGETINERFENALEKNKGGNFISLN